MVKSLLHVAICLFVYLFICLFVYLFICLFVFLFFISVDILKVSSNGGYALAKITNTLKKNTLEKLKEFVSLHSSYFSYCTEEVLHVCLLVPMTG